MREWRRERAREGEKQTGREIGKQIEEEMEWMRRGQTETVGWSLGRAVGPTEARPSPDLLLFTCPHQINPFRGADNIPSSALSSHCIRRMTTLRAAAATASASESLQWEIDSTQEAASSPTVSSSPPPFLPPWPPRTAGPQPPGHGRREDDGLSSTDEGRGRSRLQSRNSVANNFHSWSLCFQFASTQYSVYL